MNGNGSIDWKEVDSFNIMEFLQQHDIIFSDINGLSMEESYYEANGDDNKDTEFISDSKNDSSILKLKLNDEL